MSIYYLSNTQKINYSSVFINAGNTNRSFTKTILSAQNTQETIGNKVIQNNNTDKANSTNNFAQNNQRPTLNKGQYGNLVVINDTKQIRATLTNTAITNGQYNAYSGIFSIPPVNVVYYVCPQNYTNTTFKSNVQIETHIQYISQSNFCFQFGPPTQGPHDAPLILDDSGGFIQSGIYINYRLENDLYGDWSRVFVPQSNLIAQSGIAKDGTSFVYNIINLENILPDGVYTIQYAQF